MDVEHILIESSDGSYAFALFESDPVDPYRPSWALVNVEGGGIHSAFGIGTGPQEALPRCADRP